MGLPQQIEIGARRTAAVEAITNKLAATVRVKRLWGRLGLPCTPVVGGSSARRAVAKRVAAMQSANINTAMVEKQASTEARTKLLGYQLEEHARDTAMLTDQRALFQTAWEAQVNPTPARPPGPLELCRQPSLSLVRRMSGRHRWTRLRRRRAPLAPWKSSRTRGPLSRTRKTPTTIRHLSTPCPTIIQWRRRGLLSRANFKPRGKPGEPHARPLTHPTHPPGLSRPST